MELVIPAFVIGVVVAWMLGYGYGTIVGARVLARFCQWLIEHHGVPKHVVMEWLAAKQFLKKENTCQKKTIR